MGWMERTKKERQVRMDRRRKGINRKGRRVAEVEGRVGDEPDGS
jgi:hypothetical protein